ncbi:class II lanthipeptide, LchA2/BrtA2 family [Paenibacillus sp. FSL R10-2734]|uniref:class II lanthipeptide, LchA2/BrtA2 family n=1 Tax=Paenibacillus sp. FSL R10-2734 TaxID=2954691 RepID=UPI0030D98B2C
MKKDAIMFKLNQDPTGFIEEMELSALSDVQDPAGGTSWGCAIFGGIVAVTVALCPTTKCTSQCGK